MYRLHSTIEKWCEMRSHRIQSTHRIPYGRRNPSIGPPAYLRRREDSKKLYLHLIKTGIPAAISNLALTDRKAMTRKRAL